jgi:hypothetical protein
MSDFARLAGQQCPPHEALALGLAAELGVDGGSAARRTLHVLARALPAVTEPHRQLEALRTVAAEILLPRSGGPFLLPEILRESRGHPTGVAIVLAILGERAAYRTALVGHGMSLYVAHRDLAPVLILDPSRPEALADPRDLAVDLSWRCAHEATGVLLRCVSRTAERTGDLTRSLGASALLLALPVDERARSAQTAMHQRLLSRLN